MVLKKVTAVWRSEQLGLMMIIASLGVIVITVFLLFHDQLEQERKSVRDQGLHVIRLLSRTPYRQVVPQAGQRNPLEFLSPDQTGSHLAYALVTDNDGRLVDEISAQGVVAPEQPAPHVAPGRLGERILRLESDRRDVTEFYATLSDNGNPDGVTQGRVQIAFFTPVMGLKLEQLPFLATLALPIFLLTPLFYFLIRREFKPLKTIGRYIETLEDRDPPQPMTIQPSGELGEFITRFNHFMDRAQQRVKELESDRSNLETTSKLLTYKRRRIESVLESIPDGVLVLDESGSVSLANDRFCQMLGLKSEEITGKKPAQWSDDVEVVTFLRIHDGKAQSGTSGNSVEFQPKFAPEKTLSLSSFPLFSPKDAAHIFGTLVVLRDSSSEALAKQASSDFVAHVSHELKSPLNVLAMYSESLQGEDGRNAEYRIEAANVIHDEVERLSLMINNILNITRIEMGSISIDRKRVRLRDLLQDAFDACARGEKDRKLTFKLDLPKEITPLALDKSLVRIAVNNLLTNAIKYSREEGEVVLSVDETERAIRISVRDDGIGIAPEDQSAIFEKFYRSENDEVRQRSGHGLGLSLAREIIQLHHGTLTVSSVLGEGSEFVIELSKETSLFRKVS